MQHVYARTCIQVQPTDSDWVINGGGYHHSHKYFQQVILNLLFTRFGFGLVNASAAVFLARTWKNVPSQIIYTSGTVVVNQTVTDYTGSVSSVIRVSADFIVEWATGQGFLYCFFQHCSYLKA